jgi:hypothetical protein
MGEARRRRLLGLPPRIDKSKIIPPTKPVSKSIRIQVKQKHRPTIAEANFLLQLMGKVERIKKLTGKK